MRAEGSIAACMRPTPTVAQKAQRCECRACCESELAGAPKHAYPLVQPGVEAAARKPTTRTPWWPHLYNEADVPKQPLSCSCRLEHSAGRGQTMLALQASTRCIGIRAACRGTRCWAVASAQGTGGFTSAAVQPVSQGIEPFEGLSSVGRASQACLQWQSHSGGGPFPRGTR